MRDLQESAKISSRLFQGTVSLECRHAFHFLEPLPDEFHGTFVVNQVVLADSIFPFEFTGLPRALFQPKELNRRDAKRDFESPHLVVNRSLLVFQQVLDLCSLVSRPYVHLTVYITVPDQTPKERRDQGVTDVTQTEL